MMTMPTVAEDKPVLQRTSSWIPWIFVGLFGVVLIANGTMIAVALSTFTGMETTSPYKKGIDYNKRLAAAAQQESLGWTAFLDAQSDQAASTNVIFELHDQKGNPIAGADVQARLDRPLQQGFDQLITFKELGSGRYAASVALPLKGQWKIQLKADVRGRRYQLTERIRVR
ncbi:MAG: FixH family protein [Pseudomonadota bacterium]